MCPQSWIHVKKKKKIVVDRQYHWKLTADRIALLYKYIHTYRVFFSARAFIHRSLACSYETVEPGPSQAHLPPQL